MSEPRSARRPRGLFEELLGGRLEVLWDDMEGHAEKYEPEARELVRELVARAAAGPELDARAHELLDRAVLDFARSAPRQDPRAPGTPAHGRDARKRARRRPMDMSLTDAPLYWWLRDRG